MPGPLVQLPLVEADAGILGIGTVPEVPQEEALPEDGYDSEVLELHPSSSSSSGKDDGNGWDSEDSDPFLAREEMYN